MAFAIFNEIDYTNESIRPVAINPAFVSAVKAASAKFSDSSKTSMIIMANGSTHWIEGDVFCSLEALASALEARQGRDAASGSIGEADDIAAAASRDAQNNSEQSS